MLEPAGFLARALRRHCDMLDSLARLSSWLLIHNATTVLLVAARRVFTLAALSDVFIAFWKHGSATWGLLTADDLAGFTFASAKLIAPQSRLAEDGVVSPVRRRVSKNAVAAYFTRDRVHDMLRQDWHTLTIESHTGGGSHANLEWAVLCGLLGESEVSVSGRVIPGCSSSGTCKRVNDASVVVHRACDLRARVLVLLGCNTLAFARELYPSDASLVLSAGEGYPAAIIGTIRRASFGLNVAELLSAVIRTGMTLGELTAFQNGVYNFGHENGATFILYGDPAWRLDASNSISVMPTVSGCGEFSLDTEAHVVWLDVAQYSVSAALEIQLDNALGPVLTVGKERAVILRATADGISGRLIDRSVELDSYTKWLQELTHRLGAAEAIERAVHSLYWDSVRKCDEFRDRLAELAGLRSRIEMSVWSAIREINVAKRSRLWDDPIGRWKKEIQQYVDKWDQRFATVVRDHLIGGAFYELLHYYQMPTEQVNYRACVNCGMITSRVRFAYDTILSERIGVECRCCGPLIEHAAGQTGFVANPMTPFIIGHEATIHFSSEGVSDDSNRRTGVLVGKLYDKGRSKPFHSVLTAWAFDTPKEIKFQVPEDLRYDLHTARFVWIRELSTAFTRCCFPVAP